MIDKQPIILFSDDLTRGKSIKSNIRKENRLLKGIVIHPDNMRAAAKFAGIRTMADAYRTLDRLSLRKDYQQTLATHGVDMNFIVTELKGLAIGADLDSTRLKAIQVFLKSLGLDSYGKEEEGATGWEKTVGDLIKKENRQTASELLAAQVPYAVNRPVIPDSVIGERQKEDRLGKELYES